MDDVTCRKLAQLIAGLVVTDDELDPAEDAFISKMLKRFGIPEEERGIIFPILDASEAAQSFARLSAEVQQAGFAMLLEAAAADGKVVPEEQAYLNAVGTVLGLDATEVTRRLAAALKAAAS